MPDDKKPSDCQNVAELIDLLGDLLSSPAVVNEESGKKIRPPEQHEVYEAVHDAIEYYGWIKHKSLVFWSGSQARFGTVNWTPCREAKNCPWPIGRQVLEQTAPPPDHKPDPLPEKVAGFISQHHW